MSDPGPLKTKRPRSLTQHVVEALSQRIAAGALQPGEKLPSETEIMQETGVSRTVVREAISRMQAGGFVETRRGIGTFVLQPRHDAGFRLDPATIKTTHDVLLLLELRISLETESAGLAAMRRTPEQLAQMREQLAAFSASLAKADDAAITPDFEFHLSIARATANRYFVEILTHLGATIIPRARINSAQLALDDQARYLARVHAEHEGIYDAIARQDAEAARAAMRTHLSNSRERLRRFHDTARGLAPN
jgi:GntR family transcriptional regulator, transcriptional repressor for pyruvate dehydrogenase complex